VKRPTNYHQTKQVFAHFNMTNSMNIRGERGLGKVGAATKESMATRVAGIFRKLFKRGRKAA
jgi:hypothetical protein